MYDVICIGAGPSGLTLSYLLAKSGFNILLLEKSSVPYEKPCGGGLTPKAINLLDSLDFISYTEFLDDKNIKKIKGLKVYYLNKAVNLDFLDNTFGVCIRRSYFNNILFQKALKVGVKILNSSLACKPIIDNGYICGVRYLSGKDLIDVRGKIVVYANGPFSKFGGTSNKYYKTINTICELKGSDIESEYFEFYFDKLIFPGYFWKFPFVIDGKNYYNIGIVTEKKVDLLEIFQVIFNKYTNNLEIIEKPRKWFIPYDFMSKKLYGNGWLLIGDSAGVANPLTGEGIYYGILSAKIAEEVIKDALINNEFSEKNLVKYKILIEKMLKKEYNLFNKIKGILPFGFLRLLLNLTPRKKNMIEKYISSSSLYNINFVKIVKSLIFNFLFLLLFFGCAPTQKVLKVENAVKKIEWPSSQAFLHYSRGLLLSQNLLFNEAIEEYKKALEYDPDSLTICESLVNEYIKVGNTEEAIRVYKKIAEIKNDINVRINIVKLYIDEGKMEEAIKECKDILLLDSNNIDAYFYLGNIYYKQGKYDDAIDYYKKVITLDPNSETGYFNLGLAFSRKGDYANAEASYLKSIEISPDYSAPIYALALLYQIQNKLDLALDQYKKLINITPYDSRVYLNLGLIFTQEKKYEEAIECFEKAIELDPFDTESLYRLSLIYYQEKRFEESLEIVDKILEIEPDNFEAYHIKGVILVEKGELKEGIACFEKLIELNEKDVSGYLYLAYIYGKEKQNERMVEVLEKASSVIPNNKEIKLYLGEAYFELKRYEDAERVYKELIRLDPLNDKIYYYMGAIYEKMNRIEDAVNSFRKVIELNPKNADAYNYIGYMYADRNINLKEALELIKKALELEPTNGAYVDSLGWVYFREGKFDEALIELEKACKLLKEQGIEDATVYEHLGDVYIKKDMIEKAREMYNKSLNLNKENESLKKKIDEIEKAIR